MDEHAPTDSTDRRRRSAGRLSGLAGVSRYDLVLLAIPLVLALGLGGAALSVPSTRTVGAAALVAALTVAVALFRNPPTRVRAERIRCRRRGATPRQPPPAV